MQTTSGPPPSGNAAAPLGPGPVVGGGRRGPATALVVIAVGVVGLLGWMILQRLDRVQASVDGLSFQLSTIEAAVQATTSTTTTIAPPVEVPPPDAADARAAVVASVRALFDPERVESAFADPAVAAPLRDLVSRFSCAGSLEPVVTVLGFSDFDTAYVHFDVTGDALRAMGAIADRSVGFDTFVRRTPQGWKVDASLVEPLVAAGNRYLGAVQGC